MRAPPTSVGRTRRTAAATARPSPAWRSALRRRRDTLTVATTRRAPRPRHRVAHSLRWLAPFRKRRTPLPTTFSMSSVRAMSASTSTSSTRPGRSWERVPRISTPKSGSERITRSAPSENATACALRAACRKMALKGSDPTTRRAAPTSAGRTAVRSRFCAITRSARRSPTKLATRRSPRLAAARSANASASNNTRLA